MIKNNRWPGLGYLFFFDLGTVAEAGLEAEAVIASLSLAHFAEGMPALSLRLSSFLRRPTDGSSILDSDG